MNTLQSVVVAVLCVVSVSAQPTWFLEPSVEVSVAPDGSFDGERADGAKLIQLVYPNANGVFAKPLVSVWLDAQGGEVWQFDGAHRPARDVLVSRSLDQGRTWSVPVNLSKTATLSSKTATPGAGAPARPYLGDSLSPMIHSNGKQILVTWLDRYCPGDRQRAAVYPEQGLEVPYACLYEVRSHDGGASWTAPRRLTDGLRDAWRNALASGPTGFALVWQEDPRGLQPGEGEGPGEGGSGARVSPGTDVWFTSLTSGQFVADAEFPAPCRISDNFTATEDTPDGARDSGIVGASRPQVALVDRSAVVIYEETKRVSSTLGKYVRYHWFPAFSTPVSDPTAGAGCILSDPMENARRGRLVIQPPPLRGSSRSQLLVLWRQGEASSGGPADIVGRIGHRDPADPLSDGLRIEDLYPPADPSCASPAGGGAPPINLSSSAGLASPTGLNPLENARAHRAVLRGDDLVLAYVYTPNWSLAENTELENYDLHVRRSFDGGQTWGEPRNVTQLPKSISVLEPRLMGAPLSPDPDDRVNPLVHMLAWVEESISGAVIRFTRTTDLGETYEPTLDLAGETRFQYEPQIRISPDGTRLYALWLASDSSGVVNSNFRTAHSPFSILDADGNGRADALTDGVLILRAMFGFSSESLIAGALDSTALRPDASTVEAYLGRISGDLDIDADGRVDALTDGLLILRYLFGFRGWALVEGAVGAGATRSGEQEIQAYLDALG